MEEMVQGERKKKQKHCKQMKNTINKYMMLLKKKMTTNQNKANRLVD